MDHDDAPARVRVDHRDDAPSQGGSHAIDGPRASADSGHSSEAAAEPAADPSARGAAGSQADPAPIPVVALAGEAAPAGRKLTDEPAPASGCLLYTSDAADDMQCVDLGGRRII